MQDNPPPEQILDIAIAHLRDNVLPTLSGRAVFDMRVTISALELVCRSIVLTPGSDAAERQRLSELLGQDGDLETLNRALCDRIASGALDLQTPGLAAHLRATALEKLAVDQPNYSAYRRARQSQ
ncbi:MAG: protein kinase [Caulobacterales bacterium]|jgi:hypothetical protein|nr:protein kinase [Caulobacterales bacterium]